LKLAIKTSFVDEGRGKLWNMHVVVRLSGNSPKPPYVVSIHMGLMFSYKEKFSQKSNIKRLFEMPSSLQCEATHQLAI